MLRPIFALHAISTCLIRVCATTVAFGPVLLVALITLQCCVLPTAMNEWLPQFQRDSEGESPASEESSKATDPHALVASASARARRAQADRLGRLEYHQAHLVQTRWVTRYRPTLSDEQAGRNGGGCLLRC